MTKVADVRGLQFLGSFALPGLCLMVAISVLLDVLGTFARAAGDPIGPLPDWWSASPSLHEGAIFLGVVFLFGIVWDDVAGLAESWVLDTRQAKRTCTELCGDAPSHGAEACVWYEAEWLYYTAFIKRFVTT